MTSESVFKIHLLALLSDISTQNLTHLSKNLIIKSSKYEKLNKLRGKYRRNNLTAFIKFKHSFIKRYIFSSFATHYVAINIIS
ncbi:hypothetical protein BKI52_40795 [marine bacterium AO1-C]|nr:hypothetical protein BKI52_40795 [marine bacterium AO1-C]